jgi:hypothetical protein
MPPGGIYSHVTIPTLIPSCYLDLERNSLCMLQQHNVTPTTGSSTFAATFELCACTFSREYAPFLACRLRLNYVLALFLEKTIPFLHVGCQWSLASYTRLTLLNTSTMPARISCATGSNMCRLKNYQTQCTSIFGVHTGQIKIVRMLDSSVFLCYCVQPGSLHCKNICFV